MPVKPRNPQRRISRSWLLGACAAAMVMVSPRIGLAQSQFAYIGTYDFATSGAASLYSSTSQCNSPTCSLLSGPFSTNPNPVPVNSSDWAVGQALSMDNLTDGEVVSWKFTTPLGATVTLFTLTYDAVSDCFNGSNGSKYCGFNDSIAFTAWGSVNSCQQQWSAQETGAWSINTYDNNTLIYPQPLTITHNPLSFLAITSPTDNQLFDLDQQNYTATSSIPFIAFSGNNSSISWAADLSYETSQGYGSYTDNRNFSSASGSEQDETYTSEGGQVIATAQVTAVDGSIVPDCMTFYIDGPQGGIPNGSITSQLETSKQSYPSSKRYPTDGTGTPGLMAQVAAKESSYAQFQTPALCNGMPDLWNLYKTFDILAEWPQEPYVSDQGICTGTTGGKYIGLMQVMTDVNQQSDPNAWNWVTNTADGVGLFSGTPPSEYQTRSNKMQTATTDENDIVKQYPRGALAALTGHQLENMALLLYGPDASPSLEEQYYIPTCAGTVDSKDQCSTGWQWTENYDGNPGCTQYVDAVRNASIPPS